MSRVMFGHWRILAWGLIIASVAIRLAWYPVVTTDFAFFLRPWFDLLAAHPGLTAFADPFSDYAPLYLYLLKFLTLFPIPSLVGVKTLSLAFDTLIALFAYRILSRFSPLGARKDLLFLAAALFFALPTVMMNSSLWAQSDAVYAAPVLLSFAFVLADLPFFAALLFGIALSVKVQAIFFAPVLVGYLLSRKDARHYLLVPPLVFLVSVVPAWLAGGNLKHWLLIYVTQAGEYPYLSVSAQSAFAFAEPLALTAQAIDALFWAGIASAALAAALLAFYTLRARRARLETMVLLALASTLLLPYLLPRMHERYFYLADLFAVLYAFFRPERWYLPVIIVFASILSYMPFLSQQVPFLARFDVDLRLPAALLIAPIGVVLFDLWRHRRLALQHAAVPR